MKRVYPLRFAGEQGQPKYEQQFLASNQRSACEARVHGESQGVVNIDDLYTVEWSFIPHCYESFYVYQYATSIAASSLFADAILQEKPGAQERYMQLLRAGSSDYPYDLVKNAGVHLASPAPTSHWWRA